MSAELPSSESPSAAVPSTAMPPAAIDPLATPASDADRSDAHPALADLDQELNRLQRSIRLAIQNQLAKLTGRSMGSLKDNRHLADSIHRLLDGHGLRVRCVECGHPAILRVSPRNGAVAGAFVFDHSIDGRRTFHGGKGTLPEIRLVAKPARKKTLSSRHEQSQPS